MSDSAEKPTPRPHHRGIDPKIPNITSSVYIDPVALISGEGLSPETKALLEKAEGAYATKMYSLFFSAAQGILFDLEHLVKASRIASTDAEIISEDDRRDLEAIYARLPPDGSPLFSGSSFVTLARSAQKFINTTDAPTEFPGNQFAFARRYSYEGRELSGDVRYEEQSLDVQSIVVATRDFESLAIISGTERSYFEISEPDIRATLVECDNPIVQRLEVFDAVVGPERVAHEFYDKYYGYATIEAVRRRYKDGEKWVEPHITTNYLFSVGAHGFGEEINFEATVRFRNRYGQSIKEQRISVGVRKPFFGGSTNEERGVRSEPIDPDIARDIVAFDVSWWTDLGDGQSISFNTPTIKFSL